jgi:hypothetical protein
MLSLLLPMLIGASVPAASAPESAALAGRLAAWARAHGDADAMLVASRMLLEAGGRPGKLRAGRLVEAAGEPGPADALAEEAVRIGRNDPRIVAASAAIRSAVTRGFTLGPAGPGPIILSRTLAAGARLGWKADARGGEAAIVSAVGDGDSDIDLRVADGAGATICADRKQDFYPMCRWRPLRPATYRIEIVNRGRVASTVFVVSN